VGEAITNELTILVLTAASMMGTVRVSNMGLKKLPMGRLERYSHSIAGAAVCLCGLTIKFLGL
jgi:hypothetical protein